MKRTMVQYRVKAERLAENEAAVRSVFEALKAAAPAGIRYSSYVKEDGLTFVHLVSREDDAMALTALPAFQSFVAGVRDRCDQPPVNVDLREVGAYP